MSTKMYQSGDLLTLSYEVCNPVEVKDIVSNDDANTGWESYDSHQRDTGMSEVTQPKSKHKNVLSWSGISLVGSEFDCEHSICSAPVLRNGIQIGKGLITALKQGARKNKKEKPRKGGNRKEEQEKTESIKAGERQPVQADQNDKTASGQDDSREPSASSRVVEGRRQEDSITLDKWIGRAEGGQKDQNAVHVVERTKGLDSAYRPLVLLAGGRSAAPKSLPDGTGALAMVTSGGDKGDMTRKTATAYVSFMVSLARLEYWRTSLQRSQISDVTNRTLFLACFWLLSA